MTYHLNRVVLFMKFHIKSLNNEDIIKNTYKILCIKWFWVTYNTCTWNESGNYFKDCKLFTFFGIVYFYIR